MIFLDPFRERPGDPWRCALLIVLAAAALWLLLIK